MTFCGLVPDQTETSPNWAAFRQEMAVTRRWIALDHAAVGPLPDTCRARIQEWLDEAHNDGDALWPEWSRRFEDCRTLAAGLVNADPDEIGLVPNTSFGINMIAEGFPWQAGDNVVIPGGEFPSNVYPWLHLASRGVEVRTVPLDGVRVCPNRIAEACDSRTRVVSVSWVGYASGWRIDPAELARVAHDQGALFFLDAIQGLGVFPLDVRATGIDFMAADGHKWLLGPEGAGLLYIRKKLLNTIRPIIVGWNSVSQGNDYTNVQLNIRDAASRYESGSQNMAGFLGLRGSLQVLRQNGLRPDVSPIADRVIGLTDRLSEMVCSAGWELFTDRSIEAAKSGIVTFSVPGHDPVQLRKGLFAEKIIVSCRVGRLRAAVHGFNNEADLQRLVDILKQLTHT